MERVVSEQLGVGNRVPTFFMNATVKSDRGMRAMVRTDVRCYHVGIGLWEPPINVSMVVVGRGIHIVGYNLLAIKSID